LILSYPSHAPSRFISGPARVRALQLLCCAVVAWAGLSAEEASDSRVQFAEAAFQVMQPAMQPASPASIGAAMHAAEAGLSRIEVIVRRNDTLDQIFRRLEVSMQDLAALRAIQGLKVMLDRLKPGEMLTLSLRAGELMGFERRISPSETLKVKRDESVGFVANVEQTPLTRTPVTTHGVIRSSLFEAAASAGLRDQTALALSELFGWDIDFLLDLRAGDAFTVTYEQVSRDGEYIGDGAILAARFVNQGRTYEAVRFVGADGKARYFTPSGRSLRKAFLKTPVDFTRISSVFNTARKHPILNLIRAHKGVDYAAPSGTPVRAAGDGRVIYRGQKGGYGNVLEIEHPGKIITRYGHLSRFAASLRVGDRVGQGDVVAYVGMTGLATGPHLHFEYVVHGEQRNPQTAMRTVEAAQLEAALRPEFQRQITPLLASLNGTPLPTTATLQAPVTRPVTSAVAAR
jgi:murein DD-endopeptidase MepM/ murein hydrolase activator NlpD